jgi:hypothetical protein
MAVTSLINFSHDRNADFKTECNNLKFAIDSFAEQPDLDRFYEHFYKHYDLPYDILLQRLKQYLEGAYHYQKANFSWKLKLFATPVLVCRYLYYLIKILEKSQLATTLPFEKRTLLIDGLETDEELQRFSKLIDLFGKDNSIAVGVKPFKTKSDYCLFYREKRELYDKDSVKKAIRNEIINGIPLYLKISRKVNINIFPIAQAILDDYLYFYSLFMSYRAKFCIQERHYQTSSIKNHLFKIFGGEFSTTIQKNIHELGRNGFYYDSDVVFSMGNKTVNRAKEYGSRIGQIIPVGSVFMEYYYFNSQATINPLPYYDIVFMGINVSMCRQFVDSYNLFDVDYYDCFRWLVWYSMENPDLKICIKHHSNNLTDKKEMMIVENSKLERLPPGINSYEVGFLSKSIVTYGSTIGYELLAHGRNTIFMDPGGRCPYIPQNILKSNNIATNYKDFQRKILRAISTDQQFPDKYGNFENLCLDSSNTSENIFEWYRACGSKLSCKE